MKKVNNKNFLRQADQAAYSYSKQMAKIYLYQKAHPDKIQIIQDEIHLKDPKHYESWGEN
jgi:hypothetical protein